MSNQQSNDQLQIDWLRKRIAEVVEQDDDPIMVPVSEGMIIAFQEVIDYLEESEE